MKSGYYRYWDSKKEKEKKKKRNNDKFQYAIFGINVLLITF